MSRHIHSGGVRDLFRIIFSQTHVKLKSFTNSTENHSYKQVKCFHKHKRKVILPHKLLINFHTHQYNMLIYTAEKSSLKEITTAATNQFSRKCNHCTYRCKVLFDWMKRYFCYWRCSNKGCRWLNGGLQDTELTAVTLENQCCYLQWRCVTPPLSSVPIVCRDINLKCVGSYTLL